MRKRILFGVLALALFSCGRKPVDQVDVFDGTDAAGQAYPGATVPFGAVQLSPDTDPHSCSGYDYAHETILGFSHTHQSGPGCPGLGDFLVTPGLDVVEPLPFSHQDEDARPGYYKVSFADGIVAELTAAANAGLHRYLFKGEGARLIRIDARHCIGDGGQVAEYRLTLDDPEILGYRRVTGRAGDREVYFSAVFSEPFLSMEEPEPGVMVFSFPDDLKQVKLFAGLSSVDANGARANRVKETAGARFDGLRKRAEIIWETAFDRIRVKGGPTEVFYTNFYHTFLTPTRIDDFDGRYRDPAGKTRQLPEGRHAYSTLSLRDTIRAWNSLEALLDTVLVHDLVASEGTGCRVDPHNEAARYVLVSLGLSPAGSGEYILTAPLFRESVIRLASGKTLTIKADHPKRPYIAGVNLNGKPLDRNRLTSDEILEGGELSFQLSAKPGADVFQTPRF